MKRPSHPPLTKEQLAQLHADMHDIRAAAKRKGTTLDRWDEVQELAAANDHFDLGCWLFYYSSKVGLPGADGLMHRIDCARRIFEAGLKNPVYQFFTIFDFGERQFDTIFEMGDAAQVLGGLRQIIHQTKSKRLIEAFAHFGWPVEMVEPANATTSVQQYSLV